ncbi:MAG: acyl-CoA dehydrogenase family protein [Betaproteobacteria bacterium]|nr:acyl-CoA dehydrogenase family protein [Betaproteobacteria bacterium]
MNFAYTPKMLGLIERMNAFFAEHIHPNEKRFHDELAANTAAGKRWTPVPVVEELKAKAKAAGLWNLFLPDEKYGAGLTNLEYAPLAEITGRVLWSPSVFNCNAPDTGNMETLVLYGTEAQKQKWLMPLLAGEIRSAFAMTEPDVASSDATNIATSVVRDGNDYVINGRKWWITNAGDPRCAIFIVMGKTNPDADKHTQQSMILVPRDAPGLTIDRTLNVLGYDDAPSGHCELTFDNVRVPAENLLLGEGRGFEIAQGRLGPGRVHHCMRLIGSAEHALELLCQRVSARVAFGKPIAAQTVWQERIAEARIMIDQARLLVLNCAWKMDQAGNKNARNEIAMIKVAVPTMACQVIDWAMQAHGGGGLCDDFPLAEAYSWARILRLADGPDEVHRNAIAKNELGRYRVKS